MIADWVVADQPFPNVSRYRLTYARRDENAPIILAGPQLDPPRWMFESAHRNDADWVVFYVVFPHLRPDLFGCVLETFPTAEIEPKGDFVVLSPSDFALIKLAAS